MNPELSSRGRRGIATNRVRFALLAAVEVLK